MKKLLSIIAILCAFTCLQSVNALAETETPEGTVREIVDKLKNNQDPASILDYIEWKGVFSRLPERDRSGFGANSPEELKTAMTMLLKDPGEFIKHQFEARLATPNQANNDKVRRALAVGMQAAREQSEKMKAKIAQTEFEIGTPVITGTQAKVPLTSVLNGERKTTQVELEQVSGRWYLASLGMMNPAGADKAEAQQ